MCFHVDIIRNEPLAGSSFVLAQVTLEASGSHLKIETHDHTDEDAMWSYLQSRVRLDPVKEPKEFLHALPKAIDTTYVTASQVHDEAECPYVHPDAKPLGG
jgi:hypothetical protein